MSKQAATAESQKTATRTDASAQPQLLLPYKSACGLAHGSGAVCAAYGDKKQALPFQKNNQDEVSAVWRASENSVQSEGVAAGQTDSLRTDSRFGHDFGRVRVQHQTSLAVQPKLVIGQPGDRYEQEADRVASEIMRLPETISTESSNSAHHGVGEPAVQRTCLACPEEAGKHLKEGEIIQAKEVAEQTPALQSVGAESIHTLRRGGGALLPASARSFFEPRFGYDLSRVRVHTGTRAADTAKSINAQAFTIGRDIFFGANQYDPSSTVGRGLLAHELTHVIQQQGANEALAAGTTLPGESSSAENRSRSNIKTLHPESQVPAPGYYPKIRNIGTGTPYLIMRQPQPSQATQQAGNPPPLPALSPVDFLQEMLSFVRSLKQFVQAILEIGDLPPAPEPTTRRESRQQRRQERRGQRQGPPPLPPKERAHRALNQQSLQQLIRSAKASYDRESNILPINDPQRVPLRELYVQVLDEIRTASDMSLDLSNLMDPAVRDPEQQRYAETLTQLIEASPMTSAGLTRTTTFQQADVTAGTNYEAALEHYLDDLLTRLPTLTLTPAQKDQIFERIQVALRRAFVTVGAGPGGAIDVRAITNQQIVDKYRRVTALLAAGISNPQQMSIITESIPAYQLPNPVPDVSSQITGRTVDLSHVPPDEVDSVRFGILQAVRTVFPTTSTVQLRNAYWPVALQILRGTSVVSVRYELVFDNAGNVRAERLGEAIAREVAPAFAQLSVAAKKAQLMVDFGLAAIDDRPAVPARAATSSRPARPARPAAAWTGPELDQVKAAYDLIPQSDRSSLNGVTLVRDHQGPAQAAGNILLGFHHTAADRAHDDPGPPPHPPPHIHYYDDAFNQNNLTAVGAPGATGPGADWTITHEVGHARIALATHTANAAILAANQQLTQALAPLGSVTMTPAQQPAWTAWSQAQTTANQAIIALNQALTATPPAGPAQQATLLQAAQTAIAARDAARPGLAAAGFPPALIQNAANLDAANDALLAASQQAAAAMDQVPIFVSLATRFGFHRFTNYARTGATDEEWFAETYALHLTDPNRLNQMNRNIFLWFEAGKPMDRNWNP